MAISMLCFLLEIKMPSLTNAFYSSKKGIASENNSVIIHSEIVNNTIV